MYTPVERQYTRSHSLTVQQIPYLNRHNNVKGIHFNTAKFSSE